MKRNFLTIILLIACSIASPAQTDSLDILTRQSLEHARHLRKLYKTDQAVDTLMAALQRNTSDIEVLAELAECHTSAGDAEEALKWWTMLSSMDPENLYFKIAQAKILYHEKVFEDCVVLCKGIIKKEPIPDILAMAADSYRHIGQNDSALVYYDRVLEIKPLHAKTVSRKADLLLEAGKHDEVLHMTGSFLEYRPDDTTVLPIYGVALYLDKKYSESITVFEKQRSLGDTSFAVHYYLGLNNMMINDLFKAEREFEKAYKIDSTDISLIYNLAETKSRIHNGTTAETERLYERALKLLEPDPTMMHNIYGSRAMSFHKAEQYRKAIDYYKLSYSYNKKNISALSSIGYCYERLKEYENAREWYERYLELGKPGSAGYKFAKESLDYVKQQLFMEE